VQAMVRGHGPLLQRLVGRLACPGWGAVTSVTSLSTNYQAPLLFVGTGHAREGNPGEVKARFVGMAHSYSSRKLLGFPA
jgi:hypothetical protein